VLYKNINANVSKYKTLETEDYYSAQKHIMDHTNKYRYLNATLYQTVKGDLLYLLCNVDS